MNCFNFTDDSRCGIFEWALINYKLSLINFNLFLQERKHTQMVYSWQFLKTFLVTSRKNIRRDLKLIIYEQRVILCGSFLLQLTSVPCWSNLSLFQQHDNREWPFKKDDEKDVFSLIGRNKRQFSCFCRVTEIEKTLVKKKNVVLKVFS